MKEKLYFLDKPKNVKMLRIGFYLVLVILVIADLFVHKHPHYSWESLPGGYVVYGFLSCVVIVAVSKALGKLWLQKKEEYYD
jgi:hypothetical protein